MTREEAIYYLKWLKDEAINDADSHRCEALDMAIEALRHEETHEPIVIRCEKLLSKEDFEAIAKRIHEEKQNVIVIPSEAENISTNTSTKSTNISTDASSVERPKGHWLISNITDSHGRPIGNHRLRCDQCGKKYLLEWGKDLDDYKLCPNCGSDMRRQTDDEFDRTEQA